MKSSIKNFISAFLGAIIFSIPAIILYQFGYLSSAFFMLLAYGAVLFYKKSGGTDILNKKIYYLAYINSHSNHNLSGIIPIFNKHNARYKIKIFT